jgi:hypothetical protein
MDFGHGLFRRPAENPPNTHTDPNGTTLGHTQEHPMNRSSAWQPLPAVLFAGFLCLLMLGGEVATGGTGNPMAVAFYSFFPVALWMIANRQQGDAQTIRELQARVERLEEAQRESPPPKKSA